MKKRVNMQIVRLFHSGRSQAVRSPIDTSIDKDWETFLYGLNSFSDDFMAEGRLQGVEQEREQL
jgi:antitoxin VapB